MAPIRVGLIGLSSVTTNVSASPGDSWAASAHLPYLIQSSHYKITALLNSSVASAQAAIKRYNLPADTKAYGTPEDLANDPDIDLVVCSVRVDRHYHLTMPSIRVGKDIFVEWPLGSNRVQAEEMFAAAKKSGSKNVVGLQGRVSPVALKIKELVESKAIGDLLSSQFTLETGWQPGVLPQSAEYMLQKESGASIFTIVFGHPADSVLFALGGIDEFSSVLATRWPEVSILAEDGSFHHKAKCETPDHIMLHGTLSNSGAPFSINVRSGKAFKDSPACVWRILGTKGEIRLTAYASFGIAVGGEKIELYDHEKDSVEEIHVEYTDAVKDLPMFAKNTGAMYELFAKGGTVEEGFVDFEQAVRMHEVLDKMEKSWENKQYSKLS